MMTSMLFTLVSGPSPIWRLPSAVVAIVDFVAVRHTVLVLIGHRSLDRRESKRNGPLGSGIMRVEKLDPPIIGGVDVQQGLGNRKSGEIPAGLKVVYDLPKIAVRADLPAGGRMTVIVRIGEFFGLQHRQL